MGLRFRFGSGSDDPAAGISKFDAVKISFVGIGTLPQRFLGGCGGDDPAEAQ